MTKKLKFATVEEMEVQKQKGNVVHMTQKLTKKTKKELQQIASDLQISIGNAKKDKIIYIIMMDLISRNIDIEGGNKHEK